MGKVELRYHPANRPLTVQTSPDAPDALGADEAAQAVLWRAADGYDIGGAIVPISDGR